MRYFFQTLILSTFFILSSCSSQKSVSTNSDSKTVEKLKTKIVFLIGEREYNTRETLPAFAERNFTSSIYDLEFIHADSLERNSFSGIESLKSADLLVLSVRRRTLPSDQFSILNEYIWSDKPIVAIRTSSHAFELRNEVAPEGHQQFKNFDRVILGGDYEGHYGKELQATVLFDRDFLNHPILNGVPNQEYTSLASLYRARDLEKNTEAMIWAKVTEDGKTRREPVAWTHLRGKQKVFYTSLGHESDFTQEYFQTVLKNGMLWALDQ